MAQLRRLNLSKTQIADAGLGHLKGLAQLQGLLLSETQVTDTGLEHLKELSQLFIVWYWGDSGDRHWSGTSKGTVAALVFVPRRLPM